MKRARILVGTVCWLALLASRPVSGQTAPKADPLQALAFLQGTWEAKGAGQGAAALGTYKFQLELGNHVLARHAVSTEGCKGPATYDCEHGDLLYVYQDEPEQALKAIYFDNEGHVIHYEVSTPTPASVIFLSDASQPGPQFRLMYELKDGVMAGKFQMRMPGGAEWRSYLEWSGGRKV